MVGAVPGACGYRPGQVMCMSDEEPAAVNDGHTALNRLLERLASVPTPSGPTPRQLLPIVEVRRDADDHL